MTIDIRWINDAPGYPIGNAIEALVRKVLEQFKTIFSLPEVFLSFLTLVDITE